MNTTMGTVRLDKYLSLLGLVPRRQVGSVLKAGIVRVDGVVASKGDMKIVYGQHISYGYDDIDTIIIPVKEFIYVLLYKPAGYVCSELDEGGHLSYKNLLTDCPYASMLHVAGRLDQDTAGLIVCSNDGKRIHHIISPKNHMEKEYFVRTRHKITHSMIKKLQSGVTFLPGYPGGARDDGYVTLPAKVYPVDMTGNMCDFTDPHRDEYALRLVITEGRFHQVKRMLLSVDNEVIGLRRDRIGNWDLVNMKESERKYIDVSNNSVV